jgi:diguanylate cyclase (GGDEF)-like protein
MKILLIEDDARMSECLLKILAEHRYTVDLAQDGKTALDLIESWKYDLILMDLSPQSQQAQIQSLALCQRIRAKDGNIPILMLTDQDSAEEIIRGLDAGVDDVVLKTAPAELLLARIRSLRRRRHQTPTPQLQWGSLYLDPIARRVTFQNQALSLRDKEYVLMELLLRSPHRTFSRSAIVDHLWTADNYPSEATVTHLIQGLQHRLTIAGLPQDTIQTVHGLGYRLKPSESLAPLTPVAQPPGPKAESASLEQLSETFLLSARHRLLYLQESASLLGQGQVTSDRWQFVKQDIHRLAGSFGTYGYSQASDVARSLDRLLTGDWLVDQPHLKAVMAGLTELNQALTYCPMPPTGGQQPPALPLVLVISEDDLWVEGLQREAHQANLQVEGIPDWSPAQQRLLTATPQAIALEFSDTNPIGGVLEQLQQRFPAVPLVTVARQDSLACRVASAQAGSTRYLAQPLTPQQLFEAISPLIAPFSQPKQGRVLIMDDDPDIHRLLAQWLEPWGVEVTSLEQPTQFWQILTQTNPDLLLLDIEMPTFNGIELCRVVRQDAQYNDLPILVITSHDEPGFIQQVYDAGADDLIRKPMVESELVVRVINRIERSRLRQQVEVLRHQQAQVWQQQATTDALTQIANRRSFDEFLRLAWQQLLQEGAPLSLILCDVDEFKIYNDYFGHIAGDLCLQQIAAALQRCIKPDIDQVARYGGEELAIVLPHTPLSGAISVVERIQEEIANLKIPHGPQASHPYVTLSLGISGTTPKASQTALELISTADRALYAAKGQGRNSYCLYPL